MTNLEHSFRTLNKFLAIASAARVYRKIYGDVLSEGVYNGIINDLQNTSDDYLYPKYILDDNTNNYDEEDFLNDVGC